MAKFNAHKEKKKHQVVFVLMIYPQSNVFSLSLSLQT